MEVLLKNRANVYRAAEEMKMSYSTARAKLDEVVRALGYPVEENETMAEITPNSARMCLKALGEGKITAEEALDMLHTD